MAEDQDKVTPDENIKCKIFVFIKIYKLYLNYNIFYLINILFIKFIILYLYHPFLF